MQSRAGNCGVRNESGGWPLDRHGARTYAGSSRTWGVMRMAGREAEISVGPRDRVIDLDSRPNDLALPESLAQADALQAKALLEYLGGRSDEAEATRPRVLRPAPRWQRAVEAVHGSSRRPFTFLVDGAVLFGVGLAASARLPIAALTAVLVLVAAYMGRIYADRDSVQTQGLLW